METKKFVLAQATHYPWGLLRVSLHTRLSSSDSTVYRTEDLRWKGGGEMINMLKLGARDSVCCTFNPLDLVKGHKNWLIQHWWQPFLCLPFSICHISTNPHKEQRVQPDAHQKHSSVSSESRSCAQANTWPPTLDRPICVFFHFISLHSSWLCDLHYWLLEQPVFFFVVSSKKTQKTGWARSRKSRANGAEWAAVFCLYKLSANTTHLHDCGHPYPEVIFSWWISSHWPELLSSFPASPLGLCTQHTPPTRLSKRRTWRNMWVSPLVIEWQRAVRDLLLFSSSSWQFLPSAAACSFYRHRPKFKELLYTSNILGFRSE